jgi:P27 family predicted phage terminase small subunit
VAGRRPKDPNLKVLQGNAGKRLSNKDARSAAAAAPTPEPGQPKCPGHLTANARSAWKILVPQLDAMGVLAKVHGMPLELLCDAYGEWRAARLSVQRRGPAYTTRTITGELMHRMRPEVRIASDAWRRVKNMMTEFGITAASLSRVKKVNAGAEQDQFELFLVNKGGAKGGGGKGQGA